ncbi:MAG: aromatic ring-hydroxylating dioxygenase subunit alpha [Betaproteobacteria bacterium]|nr:aromatic ring-hydroxylating dioxygenase subunit alpha [Betaproteobacteria bacterium]
MSAVLAPQPVSFEPSVADIFDPAHYADVRKPLAEASTLPPWAYTSEAFYRREVETIWLKEWNFFGRADRIPKPGDYFAVDFVGVPLLVIRGKDGQVRAFSNSCRHRGAAMLRGDGNCNAIRCPYHSWAYDYEGQLIVAPEMEQTTGFRMEDFPLLPLKLELWEGFIFINLDPDAIPLKDYLVDLPEVLASYHYDNMVCVRRKEFTLECNWKIYVENAMEAYHVSTVHRSTLSRQKGQFPTVEPAQGQWMALHKEHEGTRALLPGDTGFPRIPTLEGKAARGSYYPLIFPSTMYGSTVDCMWWLELQPLSASRTKLIVGSCFPKDVTERPDFEEVVQRYYKRWDISIPEDNDISALQQIGLALAAVQARPPVVRRAAGARVQQLGARPGAGTPPSRAC